MRLQTMEICVEDASFAFYFSVCQYYMALCVPQSY